MAATNRPENLGPAGNSVPAGIRLIADLPGPKGVPLFGNLWQLESPQFHLALENWAREFGPRYKFHAGRQPILASRTMR